MTADPLLDPTDVDAAVDSFRIPFDLAATGTGGFTVGMVTAAVVYAAYPPVHTRGPIIIAGDDDRATGVDGWVRSEEHTSELQSRRDLVCRLLLEKKKT